ncbi:MAG: LysR family transcriptional regulator [Ottowia sp.]|nr:LysR family transcriptional regulator [Ottowia sp.]
MNAHHPWQWFQRIVERGAISAAAQDLGISNAALSQWLKREERRLGMALFH